MFTKNKRLLAFVGKGLPKLGFWDSILHPETLRVATAITTDLAIDKLVTKIIKKFTGKDIPFVILELAFSSLIKSGKKPQVDLLESEAFSHPLFSTQHPPPIHAPSEGKKHALLFTGDGEQQVWVEIPEQLFDQPLDPQRVKLFQIQHGLPYQVLVEYLNLMQESKTDPQDARLIQIETSDLQTFDHVISQLYDGRRSKGSGKTADFQQVSDSRAGLTRPEKRDLAHDAVLGISLIEIAHKTIKYLARVVPGLISNIGLILGLLLIQGDTHIPADRAKKFKTKIKTLPPVTTSQLSKPKEGMQFINLFTIYPNGELGLASVEVPLRIGRHPVRPDAMMMYQYASNTSPKQFAKTIRDLAKMVEDHHYIPTASTFEHTMDLSPFSPYIEKGTLLPIPQQRQAREMLRDKLELLVTDESLDPLFDANVGGIWSDDLPEDFWTIFEKLTNKIDVEAAVLEVYIPDKETNQRPSQTSGKITVKFCDHKDIWLTVPDRLGTMNLDANKLRAFQLGAKLNPHQFASYLNFLADRLKKPEEEIPKERIPELDRKEYPKMVKQTKEEKADSITKKAYARLLKYAQSEQLVPGREFELPIIDRTKMEGGLVSTDDIPQPQTYRAPSPEPFKTSRSDDWHFDRRYSPPAREEKSFRHNAPPSRRPKNPPQPSRVYSTDFEYWNPYTNETVKGTCTGKFKDPTDKELLQEAIAHFDAQSDGEAEASRLRNLYRDRYGR